MSDRALKCIMKLSARSDNTDSIRYTSLRIFYHACLMAVFKRMTLKKFIRNIQRSARLSVLLHNFGNIFYILERVNKHVIL